MSRWQSRRSVVEQWLAELDGKKYRQGRRGFLHCEGKYCPLGVLCDLYQLEYPHNASWEPGLIRRYEPRARKFMVDGSSTYGLGERFPPDEVLSWAGISPDYAEKVVRLYDRGNTFKQVADSIRGDIRRLNYMVEELQ